MNELIDREATVKQICKMGEMLGNSHDRDVIISVSLFVQDDKSAFPTVEQRPHGEWEYNEGDYRARCSNCHRFNDILSAFCPNCGADMRKRGEVK